MEQNVGYISREWLEGLFRHSEDEKYIKTHKNKYSEVEDYIRRTEWNPELHSRVTLVYNEDKDYSIGNN